LPFEPTKPSPFKPTKPLKDKEPKPVQSKLKQEAPSKNSRKIKESSHLAAPNPEKAPHLRKNKATPFRNRNQDQHRTFRSRNPNQVQ
jgi:hypothetical protein